MMEKEKKLTLLGGRSEQDPNKVKTILVVEDDVELGDLLTTVISEYTPYHSYFLRDAANAEALIKNIKLDLLIVDYKLRGTTGIELYDQLQSLPEFKGTPTFLISGMPEGKIHQHNLEILKKPFDLVTLLSKIEQYLLQ